MILMEIKKLYNFTYRLSGNFKVAEALTEGALLRPEDNHNYLVLLKQAWEDFNQYYGSLDFQGQEPVQNHLLNLVPEERCAVILRDIMGYSYEQIALVLDKSIPEVNGLIRRGRQQICKLNKKTKVIN